MEGVPPLLRFLASFLTGVYIYASLRTSSEHGEGFRTWLEMTGGREKDRVFLCSLLTPLVIPNECEESCIKLG